MYEKLPSQWFLFIVHFIRDYKKSTLFFVILSIIAGGWGPCNGFLVRCIVDALGDLNKENIGSAIFRPLVLLLLNFFLFTGAMRGMAFIKYNSYSELRNKIIRSLLSYLQRHSYQFFKDHLAGQVANQIHVLADGIEYFLAQILPILIRCSTVLLISFTIVYSVDIKFFFVLFIWFLIIFCVSLHLYRRLIYLTTMHADAEAVVAGQLVDSITNISNVQLFARGAYEITHLEYYLADAKNAFQRKEKCYLQLHLFQGISIIVMLAFVLYFLLESCIANKITLGKFVFIVGLAFDVGFMTWWFLDQVDLCFRYIGKWKQSLTELLIPLSIKDQSNAPRLQANKGEIVFSHVTFYYRKDNPLFQKESIIIYPGQKVGLVGYSGSGKSTFVHLILRLYDPVDGQILIDGQDIRSVTQDSLREAIAMIPQDPSLFHRSLIENIRYGEINASDARVIEAAKQADAHGFIITLPQQYNTLVGERGVKLSGGQRQRIAITRAILKNAPILVLDEATSNLDSVTENYIQKNLLACTEGKTTLVIAHRLSTLLHMDRILVFSHGKIVADDNHSQLLKQGGLYKQLWDAQISGFLPDFE